MGRVLTNNTGFAYAIEESLGVLPAQPEWKTLEPNDISDYGPEITTTARDPISQLRQLRKGAVTDLDSTVGFDEDLTCDSFIDFIEGFVGAVAVNIEMDIDVSAVDGTGETYSVAALSAVQADKLEFVALQYATLIFGRGFQQSPNNGLKEVAVDAVSTDVIITVSDDLVDETPPANARVELAGLRSLAGALDFTWDWDPSSLTAQLISASNITDFTQFGLTRGQFVHFGSSDGAGGVTNAFENAGANDMFGYARIKSFSTGAITFDKVDDALRFDDLTAPATAVDMLFGKFVRNVSVTDPDFLERSYQFEAAWENLADPGPGDEYEYSLGNRANTMANNLPLSDKADIAFAFTGTDTNPPTGTRETNADTPVAPLMTEAFNTSSDIARLGIEQIDETGITTDFKSLTVTLNNNVNPEKVLAQLGAKFINNGNFEVNVEAQALFTSGAVLSAIRNNDTVTMSWRLKNDDCTIYTDIPSMTLGGGGRELPRNESVRINFTGQAFVDDLLQTSIGVSIFPTTP